jgi:glycosyltransferase involved in cell wall biosynthesis
MWQLFQKTSCDTNRRQTMNESSDIFFSIVIPTHNRSSLLKRALDSVFTQSVKNIEVVVINDGSTEDYTHLLNDLPVNCRYIKLPHSSGVSCARNRGILEAKGKWIVFLDDDDELAPQYLENIQKHIKRNQLEDSLVFMWGIVQVHEYGPGGVLVGTSDIDYSKACFEEGKLIESAVEIGTSYGLVVNRQVFCLAGLFDSSFKVGEDTEFVIRMLSHSVGASFIPVIGVVKHNHTLGRLSDGCQKYSELKVCEKILLIHNDFFKKYPSIYMRMLRRCIEVHYISNDLKSGDAALHRSVIFLGASIKALKYYFGWKSYKWVVMSKNY